MSLDVMPDMPPAPDRAATDAALRLQDKVIFVAGGGSAGPGWSIGRASCVLYARLGAKVCVADRDRESADITTACIRSEGGTALTLVGDAADEADVQRMVG